MSGFLMVSGSRADCWQDHRKVKRAIVEHLRSHVPPTTVVMQGESPGGGVDVWTREACEITGHNCLPFPPDPRFPSPQRYHMRNDAMLYQATEVLAVWDGKSSGTKSVVNKARWRLPLWIIYPEAVPPESVFVPVSNQESSQEGS